MKRDAVAAAYGLLWLVMGDSSLDQNVRLARTARALLREGLEPEELRGGIERAKGLAKELNRGCSRPGRRRDTILIGETDE